MWYAEYMDALYMAAILAFVVMLAISVRFFEGHRAALAHERRAEDRRMISDRRAEERRKTDRPRWAERRHSSRRTVFRRGGMERRCLAAA